MLALSVSDSERVGKAAIQIARKVLGQQVTYIVQDFSGQKDEWKSLPNSEVRRKLSNLPHAEEMRLRRIKTYQRLIEYPVDNTQFVALLFHQFSFETEPQIDAEGRINEDFANPWLVQIGRDLDRFFDIVEDLQLDSSIIDKRYGRMFFQQEEEGECSRAIEHFIHYDVHSTRPFCSP